MTIVYFLGAIGLLAFAARNTRMALHAKTKSELMESWISAGVCFVISFGLIFAGFSNSNSYDKGSYYNRDKDTNPHYPWESDLEQYREEKKPWE